MAETSRPAFIAGLLTIYIVWGSTYLAMRWAVEDIPPFLGAATRFLVAGLLLYTYLAVRGQASRPTRREWLGAAAVGGLMLLGGNGGVMWAEQFIASGFAALMIAMVPLLMTLLEPLFGGTRAPPAVLIALLVGFAGVGLLVWDRIALHDAHIGGVIVLFVASLTWAMGSLLSRRVARPARSLQAVAMQMLAGGTLLVLFGLLTGEGPRFHPENVSLRAGLSLVYLIIFGSLIAFTCYMWLLQVSRPTVVGTYAYVNPLVAVILGALLAAEALTLVTVLGAITVLASVAAVLRLAGARPVLPRPAVAAPAMAPPGEPRERN